MKRILFYILITLIGYCQAGEKAPETAEEMTVISSGCADYDGKKITLSEQVVVEHELGTLSAGQVILMPTPDVPKISFGILHLREDVKIALKEGGQLCCSSADVDYQQLLGQFYGDRQREYVVYAENSREGEDGPSLIVKGKRMTIQIKRENGNQESPISRVRQMTIEDSVTLNYNRHFIALADYAIYQRLEPDAEQESSLLLPGLITLKALAQNGICRVTNREGDVIRASQINIDTIKRQLTFSSPKGAIHLAEVTKGPGQINFSAGTLLWDQPHDKLTLKEHVEISQKGIGKLQTENEVHVIQESINGHKQLSSIESVSDTALIFIDEDKDLSHTLNCYGQLVIDHKKWQAHLDSPRDAAGVVLKNKQVTFQDSRGEIFADRLDIIYELRNHAVFPEKIILNGNVQVFNHLSPSNEETTSVLQYGLADCVEYFPEKQEMLFKAESGRVLFYDKINNIQVSAPGLKISRNKNTKKPSIEGVGDVRFSFVEQEFEQLRKRFSFDKNHN